MDPQDGNCKQSLGGLGTLAEKRGDRGGGAGGKAFLDRL